MSTAAPPRKRARVGLPPSRLSQLSPRPVSPARSLVNRFPNELWALILASCSAADLCCLRATHEHLRVLIDEKNSRLLKDAFKRSGLPSFQSIVARWPDVDLTRIPRRYQSTGEDEAVAYILMMCGGRCAVRRCRSSTDNVLTTNPGLREMVRRAALLERLECSSLWLCTSPSYVFSGTASHC